MHLHSIGQQQLLKVSTASNKKIYLHTDDTLWNFKCLPSCIFPPNDRETARRQHMAAAKVRPIKHDYPNMISVDVLNN